MVLSGQIKSEYVGILGRYWNWDWATLKTRVKGDLHVVWKKINYYCSSLCIFLQQKVDECVKGLKLNIVQDNRHVGYVDQCHMAAPSPLGDGHGNRWRSHFSTSWTSLPNSFILPFYCGSKLSCYIILALVSDLIWCRVLNHALPSGDNKRLLPASLDLLFIGHWCGVWCVKKEEMGTNFGSPHCNMGSL